LKLVEKQFLHATGAYWRAFTMLSKSSNNKKNHARRFFSFSFSFSCSIIMFGGGEKCPRCNKSVYAAERALAAGKGWHKSCLTCANKQCNQRLDSTRISEDSTGEVWCKSCYAANFGPKGFRGGNAGGVMHTQGTNVAGGGGSSAPSARAVSSAPPAAANAGGGAKFCPQCGSGLAPGARFCTSCGNKL
jgi:LIM domain/zinc-ribbon domain